MDDNLIINNFVECFPNVNFILLNIDDSGNVLMKINKAFNYITKLISTNTNKKFLIFTYWCMFKNIPLTECVVKQLDIIAKYSNTIYINSAGNQSFDYKESDFTTDNARFPVTFKHAIKLSIGNSDVFDKIAQASNKGFYTDYYMFSEKTTVVSACKFILSLLLLWSYFPKLTAQDIIKKIDSLSNKQIVNFDYIKYNLEKEFLEEEFSIDSSFDENNSQNILEFSVNFELALKNGKFLDNIDYIPTSLRIEFSIGNENYDIKIDNKLKKTIEFRKSDNLDKKIVMFNSDIKYNFDDKIKYYVIFSKYYIKLMIGNNNFIQGFNSGLNVNDIKKVLLRKTDILTHFKNVELIKKEFSVEITKKSVNNTLSNIYTHKVLIKDLSINYEVSVAVIFIVNIFKDKKYIDFYDTLYIFIKYLIIKGFKIHILYGRNATFINLLKMFNNFKSMNIKSRFVFYYYGQTRYVDDDNLIENNSLIAYTKKNESENLISYQQLLNQIRKLNFQHKFTILDSCNSSKIIDKNNFKINEKNIQEKCHYIITYKNELSEKNNLIDKIVSALQKLSLENQSLNSLFYNITNESVNTETNQIHCTMKKEGDGTMFLNNSKKEDIMIIGNSFEYAVSKFNVDNFKKWLDREVYIFDILN